MSGTFPTNPAFNSLKISSFQPTLVSRSISGRRQARQIGGQYWKMTATFPPMKRETFAPIHAFIIKQRGSFESFSIVLPVVSSGLATAQTNTATWVASQTTTGVSPLSTNSPDGADIVFTTSTTNAGIINYISITTAGTNYAIGNTIVIQDPNTGANLVTVTVSAINGSGGVTAIADTTPTIVYNGPPKIKNASQTGRSITTDGWNGSVLALKAGDYIKMAGNNKVYLVTADSTANTNGEATISIEPSLVVSPADNEALVITQIPFSVALSNTEQSFATSADGMYIYEMDFEEVL
tara:strand:+ start:568 stop:1452 length:885 start_codon:yes stop_codon:yes gene_type:complete